MPSHSKSTGRKRARPGEREMQAITAGLRSNSATATLVAPRPRQWRQTLEPFPLLPRPATNYIASSGDFGFTLEDGNAVIRDQRSPFMRNQFTMAGSTAPPLYGGDSARSVGSSQSMDHVPMVHVNARLAGLRISDTVGITRGRLADMLSISLVAPHTMTEDEYQRAEQYYRHSTNPDDFDTAEDHAEALHNKVTMGMFQELTGHNSGNRELSGLQRRLESGSVRFGVQWHQQPAAWSAEVTAWATPQRAPHQGYIWWRHNEDDDEDDTSTADIFDADARKPSVEEYYLGPRPASSFVGQSFATDISNEPSSYA